MGLNVRGSFASIWKGARENVEGARMGARKWRGARESWPCSMEDTVLSACLIQLSRHSRDNAPSLSPCSKENTVLRANIDPRRVSVIPNAVDTSVFAPHPSGEQRLHAIWHSTLVVSVFAPHPSADVQWAG